MTVNEIIKLLDKEGNRYGGLTGKERELNLSVNGVFIGTITSAKLDGWGDGLITDVTLELQCKEEIRSKAIDEFAEAIKKFGLDNMYECYNQHGEGCNGNCDECENAFIKDIETIAEQLKAGGGNEID